MTRREQIEELTKQIIERQRIDPTRARTMAEDIVGHAGDAKERGDTPEPVEDQEDTDVPRQP